MSFVVFLALVMTGAAGVLASSLVDAKPWSLWGLPPRTPEDAKKRYRQAPFDAQIKRAALLGLVIASVWGINTALDRIVGPWNDAWRWNDVVRGLAILVSLWGAALIPRVVEHRHRLREHPWAEDTWTDPGEGSS